MRTLLLSILAFVCIAAIGCQDNSVVNPAPLSDQSSTVLHRAAPPISGLIGLGGIVIPEKGDKKTLYRRIKGEITYAIQPVDEFVVEVSYSIDAELRPLYVRGSFDVLNEKSVEKITLDEKGLGSINKYYRLQSTKGDVSFFISLSVSRNEIKFVNMWISENLQESL